MEIEGIKQILKDKEACVLLREAGLIRDEIRMLFRQIDRLRIEVHETEAALQKRCNLTFAELSSLQITLAESMNEEEKAGILHLIEEQLDKHVRFSKMLNNPEYERGFEAARELMFQVLEDNKIRDAKGKIEKERIQQFKDTK